MLYWIPSIYLRIALSDIQCSSFFRAQPCQLDQANDIPWSLRRYWHLALSSQCLNKLAVESAICDGLNVWTCLCRDLIALRGRQATCAFLEFNAEIAVTGLHACFEVVLLGVEVELSQRQWDRVEARAESRGYKLSCSFPSPLVSSTVAVSPQDSLPQLSLLPAVRIRNEAIRYMSPQFPRDSAPAGIQ